jgi:hypothetical protein
VKDLCNENNLCSVSTSDRITEQSGIANFENDSLKLVNALNWFYSDPSSPREF